MLLLFDQLPQLTDSSFLPAQVGESARSDPPFSGNARCPSDDPLPIWTSSAHKVTPTSNSNDSTGIAVVEPGNRPGSLAIERSESHGPSYAMPA